MCRLIESTRQHVIKLPKLSQEEMQILRQKPANNSFVLTQSLALSLFDEKDGLHMALEVLLKSRKGMLKPELVKKMLKKRIALLRSGDLRAWGQLCEIASKKPELPVCQIVLQISPLREEVTV